MMQTVAYQPRMVIPAPVVEIIPASVQHSVKVVERKNLRVAAYCRVRHIQCFKKFLFYDFLIESRGSAFAFLFKLFIALPYRFSVPIG